MKLFILTATLFFGAQAYASQIRFNQATQTILKKCPANLSCADVDNLYAATTLYPSNSKKHTIVLSHVLDAERVAKYRAEKNPANRP